MKHIVQKALNLPPLRFTAHVTVLYFRRHVSRSAAQLAYFLTLTFFPILICITAFLGRADLRPGDLLEELRHLLPRGVYLIFREYLGYLDSNLSNAMLIAGTVLTALFASAAIRGVTTFVRELYGQKRPRRPVQFVYSILFALFLLVTTYLSMAVMLTGNRFFHVAGDFLGFSDLAARFGVWQWLKYLILLAIVFLFVLLLYRFASPAAIPRPPVVPGALLAAGALAAASAVFAAIVSRSARYSLVYGSLASVIILLVWLYLCGNVLILGSVVNYVIHTGRHPHPA